VFLGAGVVPRDSREDNHNQLGEDLGKYLVVRPGDLVFNKLRTWQGGLGASEHEGIVSPAYFVCRPTPDFDSRFLQYLLLSDAYLQELTRVSKWQPPSQFDIGWEQLRAVPIVSPGVPAQRAIADYLDTETARIDALITKKQQMIELFQERRQALITSAVSDGETPRRGRVARLRFLAKINPATPGFDQVEADSLIPFVPLEAVWSRGLDLSRRKIKSDVATGYTRFQEGDIVVPKITPTFQADRATIACDVTGGVAAGTTELHVVRVNLGVDRRYVRYLLSSREFLFGGEAEMIGVAGQKRVPDAWLRDFRVPILDVTRQRTIADYLDRETARIDPITLTLQRQIDLLRERRQALITAAVTGELEVPGVAA